MHPEDDVRWIRLSVTWSPNPRTEPVEISWTVDGVGPAPLQVTHSPWPTREIAVRPGEVLVLRATQTTAGVLSCTASTGPEVLVHDFTSQPGTLECKYQA